MSDREPLDVMDAIHSTRAMRYQKPDPIPEEVIWEILDGAIRGPTGGNQQGWAWVVIQDPEVKKQIAALYEPKLKRTYGYEAVPDEELEGDRRITRHGVLEGEVGIDVRNRRAVVHLADHFAESPVIVAPVMLNAMSGPDTRQGGASLAGSIQGAAQNLMLAARAYGIGSVLTWSLDPDSGINEILGLPEDAAVMALIPLGYPARGKFSQARRRPVEEVAHWDRWGEQKARPSS